MSLPDNVRQRILKAPMLWGSVSVESDSRGKFLPRTRRTRYFVADLLDTDSLGNVAIWFQLADEKVPVR